ncbi:MAG: lipoate--protein ligase family protein [Bacteroidetes bacterium]|nr:MAG: lipoate--protein ligase family protein [Bacteroidota bacterium]
MNRWRFIDSGPLTAAENMRLDTELAEHAPEEGPVLRLYAWRPWAVSLGYHQSEADIDRDRCTAFGYDVVRRPTGGRAILHANELTYCVAMPADGRGIAAVYAMISAALVNGLADICPAVGFEPSQPDLRALYRSDASVPCFSSSSRYEVQAGGRKLVGSAQRRFTTVRGEETVLQHGSVLLGPEHALLAELLPAENGDVRRTVRDEFERKTVDLSTAAGRPVSYAETAAAVRRGFERTMDIHFTTTSGVMV